MKKTDKFGKGRAGLVLDAPFWGTLALRLRAKVDPTCETAWTDGETVGYNPEYIEGLRLEEVKGLVCHEVMHCAMDHTTRRGERDRRGWNVATDYAINQILVDAGQVLPKGGMVDERFRGMSAEQIYAQMPKQSEGGEGEGDGQSGGQSQGGGQDEDQGQGAGESADPGKCGEVRDAEGDAGQSISEAEKRQVEQKWKVAMAQAAAQAKAAGDLPAGMDRIIQDIIDPKLDWREILRRFVETTAKNDYRWFPPNRRHIHNGMYMPTLRSEEVGKVAVAIDTSGSIMDEQLQQFASELSAILEDYRADCKVIYCDTEIAGVEEVCTDDLPLELRAVGGGGTDFRPPFANVEEDCEQPTCLIYFTDGWCDSFPEVPEYPVLWVLDGGAGDNFNPPFGEVIAM